MEMRQAIDTLTKKLDAANCRIASYEATQKTVLLNTNVLIDIARNIRSKRQDPIAPVTASTTFSLDDIPEEHAIGDEELRQIVRDSRNAGNFAVNLCRKLWPELYGEGNLRFSYNWYGGGKHNKQELDRVRKGVVKKYVCFFYPEVVSEDSWRERIVTRINESLRRNDKRSTKNTSDIPIPPLEPACDDDVFTFTDM